MNTINRLFPLSKAQFRACIILILIGAGLIAVIIAAMVFSRAGAGAQGWNPCDLYGAWNVPNVTNWEINLPANEITCAMTITTSDNNQWAFWEGNANSLHYYCLPFNSTYMVCAGGFSTNWASALITYANPNRMVTVELYTRHPFVALPLIRGGSGGSNHPAPTATPTPRPYP